MEYAALADFRMGNQGTMGSTLENLPEAPLEVARSQALKFPSALAALA